MEATTELKIRDGELTAYDLRQLRQRHPNELITYCACCLDMSEPSIIIASYGLNRQHTTDLAQGRYPERKIYCFPITHNKRFQRHFNIVLNTALRELKNMGREWWDVQCDVHACFCKFSKYIDKKTRQYVIGVRRDER